jgi:hypothetical protein
MNNLHSNGEQRALEQFALRVTSRLSEAAENLPHDISERLRAARVQSVDKRKWILTQTAPEILTHGHSSALTASHGHPHANWWNRIGAFGLLLVLVVGLFAINEIQDELGARELADIDAALLTDDLPPAAYLDAGFTQFLKSGNRQEP